MNNKERKIQEEVEMTLKSLDRRERLKPNPWLMTRIEERLKNESHVSKAPQWSFIKKLQPAVVVLLLFVNIFTAYTVFNSGDSSESVDNVLVDDFAYLDLTDQSLEYYIPE